MKALNLVLSFALTFGTTVLWSFPAGAFQDTPNKDITILEQWHGDYPVARLSLLPENQQNTPTGVLADAEIFVPVWQVFKPGESVPEIDFTQNLVVFQRNVDFYNRTNIFKVPLSNGTAQVMAMETMSATPIEDKVAMALAVIPRAGIEAILAGEKRIAVQEPGEAKKNRL
jgi:hypothetical protein